MTVHSTVSCFLFHGLVPRTDTQTHRRTDAHTQVMGCSSSSSSSSLGEDSFGAVTRLSRSARPLTPESQEGASEKERLDALLAKLTETIRQGTEQQTLSYSAVVRTIAASEYATALTSSLEPVREYEGGWIRFRYPDNGQWHVVQEPKAGQVRLACSSLVGISISLSMGPMASKVDSHGYCEMFTARVQQGLSFKPTIQQGRVLQFSLSPLTSSTVDGMQFFEWTQTMTVLKNGVSFDVKQLEVHGMRNEQPAKDYSRTHYGFNVSCVAPSAALYEKALPFFRAVLATVHYAPREECERLLGKAWD